MKKTIQTVLVAVSLLASTSTFQASTQAATILNAQTREGNKEWRDGRAKSKNEIKREKLGGKNDGWKAWHDGKAKSKDEIKRERLGGKNDAWRAHWRAAENNGKDRMDDGDHADVINLNTASSTQLSRLPNVGPQTAASIIRNRPYRNIAQFRAANKRFISPLEWRELSRRVRL